jgi:hypothetical protein
VDRSDDCWRSVKSVEGRALRALVLLRLEQRLQRFSQIPPAGVFVTAADRIGENRQSDRSEPRKARKRVFLLFISGPLLGLDALQRPDGRNDVAGFRLFPAGDLGRRPGRFLFGAIARGVTCRNWNRRAVRRGIWLRRFRKCGGIFGRRIEERGLVSGRL